MLKQKTSTPKASTHGRTLSGHFFCIRKTIGQRVCKAPHDIRVRMLLRQQMFIHPQSRSPHCNTSFYLAASTTSVHLPCIFALVNDTVTGYGAVQTLVSVLYSVKRVREFILYRELFIRKFVRGWCFIANLVCTCCIHRVLFWRTELPCVCPCHARCHVLVVDFWSTVWRHFKRQWFRHRFM